MTKHDKIMACFLEVLFAHVTNPQTHDARYPRWLGTSR